MTDRERCAAVGWHVFGFPQQVFELSVGIAATVFPQCSYCGEELRVRVRLEALVEKVLAATGRRDQNADSAS